MRVAICAIAKHENKYIRDWVNYHINLGIRHIYVFDNNETQYPSVADELVGLGDTVTLFNVRDKIDRNLQVDCYKICYDKYQNEYDWMMFIDLDEFLYIKDKTLEEYLSQSKFSNTSIIHLNWRYYGDNELLHYENKPVWKRFTEPAPINVRYAQLSDENRYVKSIVNCKYKIKLINSPHTMVLSGGNCLRNNGEQSNMSRSAEDYNYDEAWIRHYGTKTIEEYLERRSMGTLAAGDRTITLKQRIEWFFNTNSWTQEKQDIINEFLKTHKN